ncbi:MAG: alcohol dehydrogenase catalytic domain-containing protein [Deinococcus sp.]|nr:alcohol dehydrogenase catalytic domain-containing protein [Deinococcus sp.]
MRAARLYGARDLRVEDLSEPRLGPRQVLLQVRAVTLCGSDVHYYRLGALGDTPIREPLILGHEFTADIVAVGDEVKGLHPGQRVAVDPAQFCGSCEWCREGHPNLCPAVRFCGSPPYDGALRQYLAYPSETIFPLPESMDYCTGALLEPLGIGLHAMGLAKLRLADTVAVLGCGPIGLILIQLARISGASVVYAVDPLAYRCEVAERLGAVPVKVSEAVDYILRDTKGRGVDLVLEATTDTQAAWQAIDLVRRGGKVVLVGIPDEDTLSFPASLMRRKGVSLLISRRMKHTYERAMALVERGLVDLSYLATHRFPLEDTKAAFELASRYEDRVLRAAVEF